MKLPVFRPDVADAAMLSVVLLWALALGEVLPPARIAGALMVLAGTTLVRVLRRSAMTASAMHEDASALQPAIAVARSTH